MIQNRRSLTKKDIYKYVTSYDIFRKFCKNFVSIGSSFSSELRKDSSPSASITVRGGELFYKDFGDPMQDKAYDAITYVQKKFTINYNDALGIIANSFGILQNTVTHGQIIITIKQPELVKTITQIDVKKRNWNRCDEIFWNKFKIPIWKVKEKPIYPITHYWLTNNKINKIMFQIPPRHLGYTYDSKFIDNIMRRKIYRPFSKKKRSKWVSNCPQQIIQNIEFLPKEGGKRLFITSSYKDCLIFELINEYAIAPIGESIFIPDDIMQNLLSKWDEIIIWFDNDWYKDINEGLKFAEKYAKQYGISYMHNPDGEPKDPSDFVYKHDLLTFKSILDDDRKRVP
jgi:hypothetical protein